MSEKRRARLALADGTILHGAAFGAHGTRLGEIVFNTSMTGYQEIITDPSYAGQIVVMTAPEIGNTGINLEDHESRRAFLSGFVVRELSPVVSNWRASGDLAEWLAQEGVVGISEVDTRALTRRLRDRGSQPGVISTESELPDEALVAQARDWAGLDGVDLVREVTCKVPFHWEEPSETAWIKSPEVGNGRLLRDEPLRVVAYDLGMKYNILRRLTSHGCKVTVVPATSRAEEILALAPDGVFLSNGPGDPAAVSYAIEATRRYLEAGVPLFGICLGHQILARALGAETYRLKFGHHGGNQPVKHLPTGRVEISAHNHNFAVDPATLPPDVEVTHVNLNDNCCEGIRHKTLPAFSVQYHPEAAPGPHDADYLFAEFVRLMRTARSGGGR